ncbi:MAG: ABC transporter ATP-binding protein [Verrucomicrobiales bacterium]
MNAIESKDLTCRFGATLAVNGVDLAVPQGSIYAFLGPNGAGKTTTIKALMNILFPARGKAAVLGTDSRKLGRAEFERIGYVSENQKQPGWMTVGGLMDYCRPLYPKWDRSFEAELFDRLDVPRELKLSACSRGQRMKAALISSLAYRPELLVLDEPFSGLDPLVRQEFIEGVLGLIGQENWTIFVSSHDIDEVERLADHVGVIHEGRLRLQESTESLNARYRAVEVATAAPAQAPANPPAHWAALNASAHAVTFVTSRFDQGGLESEIRAAIPGAGKFEARPLTLKETYLAVARSFRAPRPAQAAAA